MNLGIGLDKLYELLPVPVVSVFLVFVLAVRFCILFSDTINMMMMMMKMMMIPPMSGMGEGKHFKYDTQTENVKQ